MPDTTLSIAAAIDRYPAELLQQLPAGLVAFMRQMGQEGARAYAEEQARAAVASGERQEDVAVNLAVERFVRDLKAGKSPLTMASYRAGLRRFLAFLAALPPEERPVMVSALTPNHVVGFARSLTEATPKFARGTVQHYATAVSRLYAFLLREGYRGGDLATNVMAERLKPIRGRAVRGYPRVPDDAAVAAILAAAHAHPEGRTALQRVCRLRNIAIVQAFASSGMRVAELCGLRRGDLLPAQRGAIVTGKGEKSRAALFSQDAWSAIAAYLTARDDAIRSTAATDTQPVFASHGHTQVLAILALSTKSVRKIVGVLVAAAHQQDSGVTPHRYRAWFATRTYEATGDLGGVQDLLGHASPMTTRVYTRVSVKRLRALHDQAFTPAALAGVAV
jgi:site-specific recombinase XerD